MSPVSRGPKCEIVRVVKAPLALVTPHCRSRVHSHAAGHVVAGERKPLLCFPASFEYRPRPVTLPTRHTDPAHPSTSRTVGCTSPCSAILKSPQQSRV